METDDGAIPAAQYLRMSTEHQRYSLENQAQVIARYAREHGFRLVCTYEDAGRSGLTLEGRPGLKRLLADALDSDRRFRAVLVLDVSRWGRFQDPDQAAHYEYLCRAAGVRVIYCAEPFGDEGDLASAIMKHLKRIMAGEYSRELSERVIRAQLHQARLGFKQGGGRPYGVRRVVVDETGAARFQLDDGEWKGRSHERVVLVPGPEQELATIRRIFRLYVGQRWTMERIAARLNAEGVPSNQGRPWTYARIRCVLKSEVALGAYLYNRSSRRMKTRQRENPPECWIRVPFMRPLVSRGMFQAAQARMGAGRPRLFTDAWMLKQLARLYDETGHLTCYIVDDCAFTPASATYRDRFGSLAAAYAKVGFRRSKRWRGAGAARPATDAELLGLLVDLHRRHGRVTASLIKADPRTPSVETYMARFGSLLSAYERAGLPPESCGRRGRLRRPH